MPRSSRQKQKLIYLARFLMEETDEKHPVTMEQMIRHLSEAGIAAERKSIYADLEELRLAGLDVICTKGRNTGYFIGDRRFQLPEVRLLVDAVQSSRFLTRKKSEELIGKLQSLVSRHEAKNLARNVFVAGRIKTMNESIYRNVDAVGGAIEEKKKIRFTYFEWDQKGEKKLRRGGEPYIASPYFLLWDNENYYLVAKEEKSGQLRHFRVDKMLSITALDLPCEEKSSSLAEMAAGYENKSFGMFGGKEERVTLWCQESLVGVFYDRFGSSLVTRKAEGGFEMSLPVMVSPMFFSWLMGFSGRVKVLSPEPVRQAFLEQLHSILSVYEEKETL